MSDIKRATITTISTSVSGNINSGNGSGNGGGGAGALPGNGIVSTSSNTAAVMHRFGTPDPVTSHKSLNNIGSGNGNGTSASGGSATTNYAGMSANGGGSKANKTIRLTMELFAPNSNSFPEFNYSKLIYLEKKKLKKLKGKQNGFSDPFEDNDDDVVRIAKELEKKYGTAYASGRGRSKKDDFCDIGLGYDESDSFIDNTEAYDEIIPDEVETVEGGFYINSGALVFKHLSTTEKTDEIIKMPNKPRKRALSTSSEESSSSDDERDDHETDDTITTPAAVTTNNPSQGSSSKVVAGKQKSSAPAEKRHKTTTSSDKESSDKEKPSKSKGSTTTSATSSVTVSASASPKDDEISSSEASGKEKLRTERTVKTTTVKDMLKAKRDNFLKMQEEELKTKTSNGEVKSSNSAEDASGLDSTSDDSDSTEEPGLKKSKKAEEEPDKLRPSDTKLPELSSDMVRDIQDMKDTAKNTNRIGKKFQFDEKLTEIFLRIDDACMCLDKNVRNTVLAHLEFQLMLPKYFLLRKAKQLRINQEKTKTKKAFVKLRKAVSDNMLNLAQQYQMSLKAVEDFQALHPGVVDIHKMENAPKMPKKKFIWNDTIRGLLYDLYQIRWMSYTVLCTRKESFEDFVGNFLKEKVVNIWPSGWMKYDELKRELEKKKAVPKKLKENKKPDESLDNACKSERSSHTVNPEPSLNANSKLPLNVADLYGMTTSSEVVPSGVNNMKSSDVSKLIPTHSSLSSDHLHSTKAYSSSSKVHRSSTNSPLNLCSGHGQSALKIEKSSIGNVTSNNNNNNNNTNSNQNVSNSRSGVNVNLSKNIVDLVSPSKRTDHSINSIMSSPSSTSSSVSTTPQPQHSTGLGNPLTVETNTHIINIDHFKSVTEIINTSNQLINHASKPHTNERLKNRSTTSDVHVHTAHIHTQFKAENIRRDSSSESDGVEIVGVYPARNTTSSLPLINKNKYKKSSHQESRSGDSPGVNDKVKTAPLTAAAKKSIDNSELDVNKIMKALKELEELQHTANFVPDLSSLTGSNHNTNASPLAYGKDLTQ